MRIALFTPFSPELGGGSVQLRSLLPALPEMEIDWFYLSPSAAPADRRHWLGQPLTSAQLISDLCARTSFLPGSTKLIRELAVRMDADMYWVVAHGEGVSIASELCRMGKRVHLTVHDD